MSISSLDNLSPREHDANATRFRGIQLLNGKWRIQLTTGVIGIVETLECNNLPEVMKAIAEFQPTKPN